MINIDFDEKLAMLYGKDAVPAQRERYKGIAGKFEEIFGKQEKVFIFSAPGRTEIGGNHTDHNNGCVLAAGVDMDAAAVVFPTEDNIIELHSEGFEIAPVDISDLSVNKSEYGSSESLIRGVAAGLKNAGYNIGGFKAYTSSNVIAGSGLSSSAAFEVLIGTVLSHLYCGGEVSSVKLAQIAQYAENVYFGKPSGLMDQMASSVGGFIFIDFKDTENPVIDSVTVDFSKYGYSLFIVDTKGSHADLTPDYAAIPPEMKSVAEFFGKKVLREITREQLWDNIAEIRKKCGDRAVSRALHFFDENERAALEFEALKKEDIPEFLRLVRESGDSSFKYLQNIYSMRNTAEQGLVLGLYAAESVLKGEGALRVHGGGFAGTIQVYVPKPKEKEFIETEEKLFRKDCCHKIYIRPVGGYRF